MNLASVVKDIDYHRQLHRVVMLVLDEESARALQSETEAVATYTTNENVGPLFSWKIYGVPVAVADTPYPYLTVDYPRWGLVNHRIY